MRGKNQLFNGVFDINWYQFTPENYQKLIKAIKRPKKGRFQKVAISQTVICYFLTQRIEMIKNSLKSLRKFNKARQNHKKVAERS